MTKPEPVRIGVFYDGEWLLRVNNYYRYASPVGSPFSLDGLHDAIRWWLHTRTGRPLEDLLVVEKHHVRGRKDDAPSKFDRVLCESGVIHHDAMVLSRKEKGADVLLALQAWDRATTVPLDCVVLFTGDADFVPLVTKLGERGIGVIVPTFSAKPSETDEYASMYPVTSPLLQQVAEAPSLDDLLYAGMVKGYPLTYPFVLRPEEVRVDSGNYTGRIVRWTPGELNGLIRDTEGRLWYARLDRFVEPVDDPSTLKGATVSFTGRAWPRPPRKKPVANNITVIAPRPTPSMMPTERSAALVDVNQPERPDDL